MKKIFTVAFRREFVFVQGPFRCDNFERTRVSNFNNAKKSGLFTGHDLTDGSGQEVFKISRVMSGSGPEIFKSRGSGLIGSDRVNHSSNPTGRVGLGQEVMKNSWVGSGHDPRESGHSRVGLT